MKEEFSDYHNPQEVPGMTQQEIWVRRFHDCLDEQLKVRLQKSFVIVTMRRRLNSCRKLNGGIMILNGSKKTGIYYAICKIYGLL